MNVILLIAFDWRFDENRRSKLETTIEFDSNEYLIIAM